MSDCDKVLAYLDEHGSITQMDAYRFAKPCTRLAARIADLNRKGYDIGKVLEDNADGAGKHARYFFNERR